MVEVKGVTIHPLSKSGVEIRVMEYNRKLKSIRRTISLLFYN